MKKAPARLFAFGVIGLAYLLVSCTACVSFDFSRQNSIPHASTFFRTYNPYHVISTVGRHCTSSSTESEGKRNSGYWNSRSFYIWTVVDPGREPDLLIALHRDIDARIHSSGSRIFSSYASDEGQPVVGQTSFTTEYGNAHGNGVVIVGPAYPGSPASLCPHALAVPIWINELWMPD